MVRLFHDKDEIMHGDLVIEKHSSGGRVKVFYVPHPLRLVECGLDPDNVKKYATKLIEFDTDSGKFTIFPINTVSSGKKFLKPKYKKIRKITLSDGEPVFLRNSENSNSMKNYARSLTFGPTQPLEEDIDDNDIAESPESVEQIIEILEDLPRAFTKDYDYGLGLAKPYKFIIEAIEDLMDCTEIEISRQGKTKIDETGMIFHIATDDFETIRKMLNSTTQMGRVAGLSVKTAETYNFFAEILGRPPIPVNIGHHRLRGLLTTAMLNDPTDLSEEDQEKVIGVMTRSMKSISESRPERLVGLQNDIELVNIENLIERFGEMLEGGHGETVWQKFFDQNVFILSLAFGYPIIKVGQQTSVGGRKFSGKGEKIADFLLKNSMTNNAAVVEIKKPGTELLKRSQFREGVFAPSSVLSESTIQVLDQKYQFERDIFGFKVRSSIHDIETYAVQCCLVIGIMPKTENEKKSFEFFRENSKNVQIITFDELLDKLVELKALLAPSDDEDKGILPDTEVPF